MGERPFYLLEDVFEDGDGNLWLCGDSSGIKPRRRRLRLRSENLMIRHRLAPCMMRREAIVRRSDGALLYEGMLHRTDHAYARYCDSFDMSWVARLELASAMLRRLGSRRETHPSRRSSAHRGRV